MVHEVNNPLGIIKNYIRLLSLKLPENHPGGEEIKLILEEIDRITLILNKYIAIAEPEVQPKKPVDLNRQLEVFLKMLEKTLLRPRKILLHMNLDPSLPVMPTDWNALKQIILNLVKNAAEAMPRGGRLSVRTRHVVAGKRPDAQGATPAGVAITIRDTGPGIDPELRKRLFEPYVTSRGDAHSGLGLYVVGSLVRALGGKLHLDSQPGKGTVFKIFFPL
jgi:signal transduction histidine kinase